MRRRGEEEAPGTPGTHGGVGPPAHAAAVGLGVLDGVRGQVDLQGGGVRVGPVAVGTLVGLVLVVLALVRLWEHRTESGASRPRPAPPLLMLPLQVTAPVGQEAGGTHLEIGELSESLFAARMRALVGSVACVDSARGSPMRWSPADTPRPAPAPKPSLARADLWLPSLAGPTTQTPPRTSPRQELGSSKATPSFSDQLLPVCD